MPVEPSAPAGLPALVARAFLHAKLTPVLALASVGLGVFAVWQTPKEEEPQISVPMIDVVTAAPGHEAADVERLVTEPVERAIWGLDGVEYVYSSSSPHRSLVTARFRVGEPLEPSLLKVHHELQGLAAKLPVQDAPQVRSYTIQDVPFLVLTFSSAARDDHSLRLLAAPLARELAGTPDLNAVEILGGLRRSVRVIASPERLAERGVTLLAVAEALRASDASLPAGKNWSSREVFDVDVGGRLRGADDVRAVPVGQRGGAVVRVGDVAEVVDGPEERTRVSSHFDRRGARAAVSLSFAARKGTDIVVLARKVRDRAHAFAAGLPPDVTMTVERDYGGTAGEKTRELIKHLLLATFGVTLLIALTMGWRASIVVGIAIPVTLALTLAVYWFSGYTLNRVTLFALIFCIGILVDDAIVVVENIERHLRGSSGQPAISTVIRAVSEVGNPTILATATVIAAVLPMAFVRGLMGPYMRPIPLGSSFAMVLSLLVAFALTPWAAVRLLKPPASEHTHREGRLDRLYRAVMSRLLERRTWAALFGGVVVLLLLASLALFAAGVVKVKMLPFDDRDEFQVLVDYPPTTSLAQTVEWSGELARELLHDDEVESVQLFAGEAAPMTFSGMVKHSYLREGDASADLAVRLHPKHHRHRSSHELVNALRPSIAAFGAKHEAVTRVLEIPPGPPVLATLVAEVYGPTAQARRAVAEEVWAAFAEEPSVVDLDRSWRAQRPRQVYRYDHQQGGQLGIRARDIAALGTLLFSETHLARLEAPDSAEPVPVSLSVVDEARSGPAPFTGAVLPSPEAGFVLAPRVISTATVSATQTLSRKNLVPVEYVTAELAGEDEAPVYGILKLGPRLAFPQQTAQVPWDTREPVIKWDGEWFVTYEVFRDLGTAFAIVLLLIYVLVVGWFRSYAVPVVIMAPIPISLVGIIPGHALAGAFFTATSMIGFIAGAGVIVRNSIILVDYIEQQLARGLRLEEAVISAGVLRFRPMLLTAGAVVVGSSIILFDPIFQGLAISLMAGEVAATLLSRLAVPVLYHHLVGRRRARYFAAAAEAGGAPAASPASASANLRRASPPSA